MDEKILEVKQVSKTFCKGKKQHCRTLLFNLHREFMDY